MSPSIQLLLVEAYPMVREGLRLLIDGWPDIRVASEASGQAEVLSALNRMKPSLLVVSDSGPAGVFRDRLGEIVRAADQAPVIFLTSSRDPDVEAFAVAAGAKWIVRKQHGPNELRNAIERVNRGEVWTGVSSPPEDDLQTSGPSKTAPSRSYGFTGRA